MLYRNHQRRRPISKTDNIDDGLDGSLSAADDTLGGRLISAREAAGLSTAQLARRVGVKTESMSHWELDREEPRASKLVTIGGVLGVSPTWLLCGEGEGPSGSLTSTEMMRIRSNVARLRESVMGVAAELEKIEKRLESYNSH